MNKRLNAKNAKHLAWAASKSNKGTGLSADPPFASPGDRTYSAASARGWTDTNVRPLSPLWNCT